MEQAGRQRLSENPEVNEGVFPGAVCRHHGLLRRVELGGRGAALFAVDGLVNKEYHLFGAGPPAGAGLSQRPQEMLDYVEGRVR